MRPTFARIHAAALEHNFRAMQALAPGKKIMAVVKADAYGHGLISSVKLFAEMGVDYFGVGFVEEGIALRQAGIALPILVLGGIVGSQIGLYLDYQLEITASSVFKIEAVEAEARKLGKHARVHLKFDTGMNRIGQNWRTAEELLKAVRTCTHVDVVGIYSHFATAEDDDEAMALEQITRFNQILELATRLGIKPDLIHMANSAAVMRFPAAHYSMIRPGLTLYGLLPSEKLKNVAPVLQPCMELVSQIVYMKRVRCGEGVSYGHLWAPSEDAWIATVPVGYGDGFLRSFTGKAQVLIGGKRYPVVGAICMDQFMVNLGQDRYHVGEEVVVWGRQGREEISVYDLCRVGGHIPYELPIYLTGRVPRVYMP